METLEINKVIPDKEDTSIAEEDQPELSSEIQRD